MEGFRTFLEHSTIHGLVHISRTRKSVRLFWILVVLLGFTGSGVMIYQSLEAWEENPVSTTIEKRPITEITFPKVTVCPPKNTYTDLNYDLMMTQNITLDNDTRNALTNYAVELLYDYMHDNTIMTNLSMLEDKDRYYNWYHGYTDIEGLFWDYDGINYFLRTSAISGDISTQYFGENFDAEKVETMLYYKVYVYPPNNIRDNRNVTLHFNIDKISVKHLMSGYEKLYTEGLGIISLDRNQIGRNFTPPGDVHYILLTRKITPEEVQAQKLDTMPGFRYSWYYSGLGEEKPEAIYADDETTKAFVRNDSIIISQTNIYKITPKQILLFCFLSPIVF